MVQLLGIIARERAKETSSQFALSLLQVAFLYEKLRRLSIAWTKELQRHQTLNFVFTVVYRLEIQSVMLVFSTPLVN
jgi:hypothetical protein